MRSAANRILRSRQACGISGRGVAREAKRSREGEAWGVSKWVKQDGAFEIGR